MKSLAKEILRWVVIVASGGFGLWQVVEAGRGIMRWNGDWLDALVVLVFPLVAATPFLAVAYICLRRQYRKLFIVLGVIGSVAIYILLYTLPDWLGVHEFIGNHIQKNHDLAFLAVPLVFVLLFGPICLAAWFFRLCHRLAYPLPTWARTPKTRATRWLVWLGASLIVLSLVIGATTMLVGAISAVKAPLRPMSSGVPFNMTLWSYGLPTLGAWLLFFGLVRRQPIPKPEEESLCPNSDQI